MEEAYQLDAWPRLERQIRLVLSIAGLVYLGALYLDYLELGLHRSFLLMALLRAGVALLMGASILASDPPRLPFRWLLVGSVLMIGIAELVETHAFHSAPGGIGSLPFILLIILMAFVMVPNRLWMTGLATSLVSLMFLGYQANLAGWGAPSTFQMVLYLLVTNGTGYAFQLSWNRVARRDFALRLKLEHEVKERKRAEEEASRANAAKSRFLAVMSHEIRTPLNGVLGGVQLLQETELEESQRQPLEVVAHSGHQLAMLLDDILDLARIEADRVDLVQEAFSPAELLTSVHAVLYPQASAKGLALRLSHPALLPVALVGDVLRLRQILLNLAGNAVKFTDQGEVLISLEWTEVSSPPGGVQCTFSVRDSGPGLDGEAQSRVFNPFEQGDDSIRRSHGGTGLGLAISRELVVAMGGSLDLSSAPGEGSTFSFTVELPFAEAVRVTPEMQALRPLSLLVVDDLAANRIVAMGLLKILGHQGREACSGLEALVMLQREPFDAVLLDLHMPDLDGMEVLQRLRRMPGPNAQVPVFLVTADVERGRTQAYLDAGIQGIIPKPIRKAQLRDQLAGVVLRESGGWVAEEEWDLVDEIHVSQTLADLGPEIWRSGLAACRDSAEACLEDLADSSRAEEALHRLAGLSANYGMPRLHHWSRRAKASAVGVPFQEREELTALVEISLDQLQAASAGLDGA